MLLRNFLIFRILYFTFDKFCFSVKFKNNLSNSSSEIMFAYGEKNCNKYFCFGNVKVKIDNKLFVIFINENNTRNTVQSICNQLKMDNFYSFGFQCISPSLLIF